MATMIRDSASTDSHLNSARRHQRMCQQFNGAGKFAEAIQPQVDELKVKQEETGLKVNLKEDAYDDMLSADADLDNQVRTVYENCKQFDRENPSANVLGKIFPDGKFSHIINVSLTKEPDLVQQIVVRLQNLGESHALFPLAEQLGKAIEASRKAIDSFNDAIRAQKVAEAEEEIAQAALRRQYEGNYLDARKEFGRTSADRLFPKAYRGPAVEEIEEEIAAVEV